MVYNVVVPKMFGMQYFYNRSSLVKQLNKSLLIMFTFKYHSHLNWKLYCFRIMYENMWLHANLYLSNVGNVGDRELTLTCLLYIDFKDGLHGFRRWLQGWKVCDRSWWGTDDDVIDLKAVSVILSKSMTFSKHNRAVWHLRCRTPVLPSHCGNSLLWLGGQISSQPFSYDSPSFNAHFRATVSGLCSTELSC